MSKQKQDKQGGGWQFPRPIEIIKCKEGNKEYMKERPARKPYGRIVKVCEFSLEAVAEFGDDDARTVWRLAKRAARDFLRVSWINTAIVTAAKTDRPYMAVIVYGTHYARPLPRAKPSKGGSHMQRAIQNTQAATRRRSRPLRVAGSTLTANVAFAVLKYAALTAAGVLLFRWGQGYALAERGYEAIGGEALLLGLPLFWYLTETTIRDTVRDFRKGGRHK